MQRFLLLLLLACSFTATVSAQNQATAVEAPAPAAATEGPVAEFETIEIDYGTIVQDSEPIRVFKFTNTGTEALLITNARGSCGCTVPSYSKAPVAPGETSEIKVRYDTHRIGQFRKRVTLTTNAGEEPIILTIKGNVQNKPAEPAAVPSSQEGFGGGK